MDQPKYHLIFEKYHKAQDLLSVLVVIIRSESPYCIPSTCEITIFFLIPKENSSYIPLILHKICKLKDFLSYFREPKYTYLAKYTNTHIYLPHCWNNFRSLTTVRPLVVLKLNVEYKIIF